MGISIELIAVLSGIGVIQGLFLVVYILQLKPFRSSNLLLAILVAGISLRVGKSILNYFLELEAWHRNIGLSAFLLVGPSLFLYSKSILIKNWQFRKVNYLHFTPSILYLLHSFLIPNQTNDYPSYVSYSFVLFQLFVYMILSLNVVRQREIVSQGIKNWFKKILAGVFFMWLFYLLIFLQWIPTYIGGAVFYSILIYAFSYLFLKIHVFNLEKYKNSPIEKDEITEIQLKIDKILIEGKLYLKSDLSLSEVADELSVNSRKLSQYINEQLNQNFSEYLNELRIKEAQNILCDSKNVDLKIAAIAYDSGFNNLTSFNQEFKRSTGFTPSQYRKKYL